jgi:hypothetical protein
VPILGRIGLARFAGVHPGNASGLAITLQLGLAALLWALLHRKVRQREFVVLKGDPHRLG